MEKSERVGIYTRVSTEEQTTLNQLPVLQEYAVRRGWDIIQIYDEKQSAWEEQKKRPVLQALLDDAHKRKFDIVLVWALDRFTRRIQDAVLLLHELNSWGISFVSYQERQLDTTTPEGKFFISALAYVAELESHRRSERVKAGMKRAASEGTKLGRPSALYDYNEILRLRKKKLGLRKIAQKIDLSFQMVGKILKRGW